MEQFNKVMVGLDLSEMDDALISNLKYLAPLLGIEKVYFVHVARDLNLPEEVSKTYPDLMAPVDELITKEIAHEIKAADYPKELEYEIQVKEGNAQERIIRWSKIKNIDLLVMGRKKSLEGSGSLVKNLAQKYPNPVLLIPEGFSFKPFEQILVPIDFSEYSIMTLKCALMLSQKTGAKITCCHLYGVPAGYTKTGKSFKEFSEIMLHNAKKEYKGFLSKNQFPDFECEFILKEKKDEADNIIKFAKSIQTDLLIIGSRGRTQSAAILLGSVAEKLINNAYEIPILMLKKKGESMTFFEALFQL
ncbi:universal stress protein [Negadavirga shengliensis]|uniref:Universal stress protein n=1 Tax=Negadavirga shengliensis TaxID=1389218 RepID=A0ABV9SY37_9BACT